MRVRRPLLLPLVPLYAAALRGKRMLAAEPRRLTRPVVSVGSLSAGGAGKTPVVAALAGLLARHGYAVDILSRGYGRASQEVQRVDPRGIAADFGDEPLLLARETEVPVYVGSDRYAAGLLAEKELPGDVRTIHLLDDGFQHRRLGRNLDVVLLTQEDVADCLLPAGNLREPLRRLRDADAVVLREEEAEAILPVLQRHVGAGCSLWIIQRRIILLPQGSGAPQRPLAFCGVARPEGFFDMLRAEGVAPAQTTAFADHHRYRERDIERLVEDGRRCGADSFVTTEKDAVKITDPMRSRLETVGPIAVAGLRVTFLQEEEILTRIRAVIPAVSA